jgi:hypothetical protein
MIINNGGGYLGITPGTLQIPSGQTLQNRVEAHIETQAPAGEEVVLSERAQIPDRKETGRSHRAPAKEAPQEGSSVQAKVKPQETQAQHGAYYTDNITGQEFLIAGTPIATGVESQHTGKARAVSGNYHFSPSMATAARQQLEDIMKDCSWCTLKGSSGVTPAGSQGSIKAPDWNKTEPLMAELAADPAKGGKMTPGSVEEAAVGIYADLAGITAPPIMREETGAAEFVDGKSVKWDVKSPKSPPPGARWTFDAEHQLVKIRHDQSSGEIVMLNLASCNVDDTRRLLDLINTQMTDKERENIVVLMRNEALR